MISTGFDTKVKVQQIIENQLPEFVLSESPKAADFLKQYYISQEYQGGPIDIADNLDQYLKLDNLTPEVIGDGTTLSVGITTTNTTIDVASTKGFPNQYGLFKINDEIFTYTGITTNSFTGCERGFSGITTYHAPNAPKELVFSTSNAATHVTGSKVQNLSALFLKEFYKKFKFNLTPGLEDVDFVESLDVSNFIKESKSLYLSKGTEESFRILFNVLFGVDPKIIDLEQYLIKPSAADYIRREVIVAERISGNPKNLVGQTITKSTDSGTYASVSEVETFSRKGKVFYKLGLFVGYNDRDLIEGTFTIPGKTRVIGDVATGGSVITVDSTIGFGNTGTVICGVNTEVSYTSKTINQFLNCTNIINPIGIGTDLRSDEVIFGYEDGDLNEKVELRITGVLSKFVPISDIKLTNEGERILVQNVGEAIPNPTEGLRTNKEILANCWIYNTASRYNIKDISGSTFTLYSDITEPTLGEFDTVDILVGDVSVVIDAVIRSIDRNKKTVDLDNLQGWTPTYGIKYDLRRSLKRAVSTGADLQFGNNILTSDVQNVYNDRDENIYVASNSLPSYAINENISFAEIADASGSSIQGFDGNTQKWSIISFPSAVPFITGDEVYYSPESTPINGLEEGIYYVRVLPNSNQIKLYTSRSFIHADGYVEFKPLSPGNGKQTFYLAVHKGKKVGSQQLLKKFPINSNIKSGSATKTVPGGVGLLKNGVEITNYKSDDKIYYGPLTGIDLLNGGSNYDILNPPTITIASPAMGTTSLSNPSVRGNVLEVQVDPQDFDIEKVLSVTITGGNGNGCSLEAQIPKRYRELTFDARITTQGGGVDINNEVLTFQQVHNLANGQALVYDKNGNDKLGIGVFKGNNTNQGTWLEDGNVYYPKVVGINTVQLYATSSDYTAGINTVGFTTIGTYGIHKFRLFEPKNTLESIKVLNPGSGYENRVINVKASGISTSSNIITFDNHGFNDGEKVWYTTSQSMSGLVSHSGFSTSTVHYQVIKIDDNSFRLANAGVGGTITSNYERGNYVRFDAVPTYITGTSITAWHTFKYPNIELNIDVEYSPVAAGRTTGITATPIVRGPIVDVQTYEVGTGYGSTVLNFEKKPTILIKNGKNAQLKPIITNNSVGIGTTSGSITAIDIQTGGEDYTSAPDLEVQGDGIGAKLRAVVTAGVITEVIILNSGVNYTEDKTSIKVNPAGLNALLEANIRGLSINKFKRFGGNNILEENGDILKYSSVGYSTAIGDQYFNDKANNHSPIIGWAYDGNPIYGPYGYTDPADKDSRIKILDTGYVDNTLNVVDRPSGFGNGFFVEDYKFDASGDLDESNGRFCKTGDYPDGVYAYFVGITSLTQSGDLEPKFPYFIGDTYRSIPVEDNFLIDQTNFDFNESNLIRNTFPYKVSDPYADNDFIVESNEYIDQVSIVDSVTKGSVDSFQIIEKGTGYAVGDQFKFDNTGTNGGGLNAFVDTVTGKSITSVDTSVETDQNVVFVYDNANQVSGYISTSHNLLSDDNVVISGLTTDVKSLTGSHRIGVDTGRTVLYKEVAANLTAAVGLVTDIYVAKIPQSVSVGSSIGIGTEKLSVINVFDQKNILRVKRGITATAHTVSTFVDLIPSYFSIPLKSLPIESQINEIVYFNPQESVGVGTDVGVSTTRNYTVGASMDAVSIPSQSIYLPNHPFKTNQKVKFTRKLNTNLTVAETPEKAAGGTTFGIPISGNEIDLYIINKSDHYIGVTTQVGLTTNTNGLFFITGGGDNFEYSLESQFAQITGNVQKITSKVAVSTAHNLSNLDEVELIFNPTNTVGIGTSTAVRLEYSSLKDRLLINPLSFAASGINTHTDIITIPNHALKTGDKVFYSANINAVGLAHSESYYVYRIDDSNIKLGETNSDVVKYPPTVIDLTTKGGSAQRLSLINPQISVINNNNLVFDLSHSSLSDYSLKLFYDADFKNEFVSTGSTDTFVVVGTPNTLTLNYSADNPVNLYYTLAKSGYISTSDTDVSNYSNINYIDSTYNDNYSIFGVDETNFSVSLREVPENLSYTTSNTDTLKYLTKAKSARGGVERINIGFGGFGYKRLPTLVSIASTNGKDAEVLPQSTTISRIDSVRIQDPGFEYASDKTLRPEAYVPPLVSLIDSTTIESVDVLDGGKNYLTAPNVIVVDPETGKKDISGILEANLYGTSIKSVEVIASPKGLTSLEQTILTVNNSNGVTIQTVTGPQTGAQTGVVTCVLVTPISGFTTVTAPFATNDKIFVEGIVKDSDYGTGYNSVDNGYKFFTISEYRNTNPAELEFDLSSITTHPGVAITNQQSYASVVNYNNYPKFTTVQSSTPFQIGEYLSVFLNGQYSNVDLVVTAIENDSIKVSGTYRLTKNDVIRGAASGSVATVNTLTNNFARFDIDYSLRQDKGWKTDTGKLGEDFQRLPDNDYYQNLSYTVKSPITYENLVNPVNRLLHTSGLKNFADVGITSSTSAGIGSNTNATNIVRDIIDEKRVDTINNLDLVVDKDSRNNRSKFIKFNSIKLSDYIQCDTNRVLDLDDISSKFSKSDETQLPYTEISINDEYSRFLVQVKDPNSNDIQITELITYGDANDGFSLEKANLYNTTEELGQVTGDISNGVRTLRFLPKDEFTTDYDIKVYENKFINDLAGIGTESFGFIDLTGVNRVVGVGSTAEIIADPITNLNSYFASIEVVNATAGDKNLVEMLITHDGTNSYTSDYYTDTQESNGYSSNFIGTFTSKIDSGVLSLDYYNDTSDEILVRSKVVGFGTTAVGIGTYRFKAVNQLAGTEKSLRLESNYYNIASASHGTAVGSVVGINSSDVSVVKSTVRVSSGSTIAIHQSLMLHDGSNVYLTEYPILSIGHTGGMGNLVPQLNNNGLFLQFNPASDINGQSVDVQRFDEIIYDASDDLNTPPVLVYGSIIESLSLMEYNSKNGARINRTEFDLTHNSVPVFQKTFDPGTVSVGATAGNFNLPDHFFNTGEKLTYSYTSTYAGITGSAIQVAGAANLPATVYAIKTNKDVFKVATTRANALAGTAITFSGIGTGNAHSFTMDKRLEKSLLTVDGIIQSPIAYSPVNTTISPNNGAQISAGSSIFGVAGISSITTGNLLKVEDEYMKVISVGIGSTTVGPISGFGSENIIKVERGVVGSTASTHARNTAIRVYTGSYNIVGSKIHFTDPPKGNPVSTKNSSNLDYPRSTFSGRVYLRNDYSANKIYDDISSEFTGIGQTYRVSVGGANTTGIQTGSSIVLINGMFQRPSTINNAGNNYEYIEGGNPGISSVVFTGISSTNGDVIQSQTDVNLNQLPRGGVIVSLGSTGGLGIAPLVGAGITVGINASGVINAVGWGTTSPYGYGSGYMGSTVAIGVTDIAYDHTFVSASSGAVTGTGGPFTPTNAQYTAKTGILVLTIPNHGRSGGNVQLVNNSLTFTCSRDFHATQHTYPRSTDPAANGNNLTITIIDDDTFSVGVGTGGGSGAGANITASVGAGGTLHTLNIAAGGTRYIDPVVIVPQPSYDNIPLSGVSRLGIGATTDTGSSLLVSLEVGPNSGVGSDNKFSDAADLIEKNKLFIGDLSARRMKDKFTSYSYPGGFTEQDCIDDVVDVLEATAHNLRYGGNDMTVDAAKLYLHQSLGGTYAAPGAAPPVEGEEEQVIYAMREAATMATQAMRNEKISAQTAAQYTHTFVSAASTALYMKNDAGVGIGTTTPSTATYDAGTGDLVLTIPNNIYRVNGPNFHTVTDADYTPTSGIMTVTIANHGFENGDWVKFADNSLAFECDADGRATKHTYPRLNDPFRRTWVQISNKTTNKFRVNIGISPDISTHYFDSATTSGLSKAQNVIGISSGGLTFKCDRDNNATNHSYPRTTDPYYNVNVAVAATSKSGSNDLITINVGVSDTALTTRTQVVDNSITIDQSGTPACATVASAIHTLVGIVTVAIGNSTVPSRTPSDLALHEVKSFKITRSGFGYEIGDVMTPVGIPTDRGVGIFREPFELTVLDTFNDRFSSWNFGEFDYIDSVVDLQVGNRKRYPLNYNGELLSFEIDANDPESSLIELDQLLLIFINGVLQVPGDAYTFTGGTSFDFTVAPNPKDKVSIFFYRGTSGSDSNLVTNINPSIKSGDVVRVHKTDGSNGITTTQGLRTVFTVASSDSIETNLYDGNGIDESIFRGLEWTKQKVDGFVNGEAVYKTRLSIEPQVYPTAKIIRDFSTTDTQLFVDDAQFFKYEENDPNTSITTADFGSIIIDGSSPVVAGLTAVVSAAGTISSLNVTSGGSGYVGATTSISISAPHAIGVGIGTTATATATITNGSIASATVVNPGFGYTTIAPPQVLAPYPNKTYYENIDVVGNIQGFTGIITGIRQSSGIGTALGIEFILKSGVAYGNLVAGYPVLVSGTTIGAGATSTYSRDADVIGIGVTFLDNVYNVSAWDSTAGIITCNVDSTSPIIGIGTTGSTPVGNVSWGRFYNITRLAGAIAIGVTGLTVDSGLSTYPTIQRRDEGLRGLGALREHLGA